MRLLYRYLLLLTGFFALVPKTEACSCFWTETFCDYVREIPEWQFYPRVIRGEVLECYSFPLDTLHDGWVWTAPLVDVWVKELIYGEEVSSDTLTFYGQDGLNCAASLGWLGNHSEFVIYVAGLDEAGLYEGRQVTNYPLAELPGCGPSFLAVVGEQLEGLIYPNINEMSLSEFRDEINNCVGFTETEEPEPSAELRIFPNPATDQLWVRHAPAEVQKIQLLDLHGRIVKEVRTSAGLTTEHELMVSELPAGVYLLSLTSNGQRMTRRIVKR
ncbi:MAG: T9SS type A sorting domain-containing protein [Bacteroidota bacterium]